MKYLNWQFWLIAAALTGCSNNDANGVTVGMQMALTSDASAAAPSGQEAGGGEFVIAHARAVVERIELYLPSGASCDDMHVDDHSDCVSGKGRGSDDAAETGDDSRGGTDDSQRGDDAAVSAVGEGDKLTVRGPFVVDLVTGDATPSLASLNVPAGRYRRIDVRLSDKAEGKLAADDVLAGSTLVADGTFAPVGGESMPFDLQLDFNEDARFESAEGFEIGADGAQQILLQLDVSRWFAALPVADCLSSGELSVSAIGLSLNERAQCGHIERDLKDAIKNSGRLEHR